MIIVEQNLQETIMDQGAHFHRCDFQVHSPRDTNWDGVRPSGDDGRKEYAKQFISACRQKGLDAVAITDHHDFAFFHYIKQAARAEVDDLGREIPDASKIVIFPGMELTLGVPCQALLLLDAEFPQEFLAPIYAILGIQPNDSAAEQHAPTERLEHYVDLLELHKRLDENQSLRGRYIVLPNVTDGGSSSLIREKFKAHYNRMPCVGGYLDGAYGVPGAGWAKITNGLDRAWDNKPIGIFPTSDNRSADFEKLGTHTAWVKWAEPTVEALRQACLARHTRILHSPPEMPPVVIHSLEVSNSKFLGPIVLELNPQYNCFIGGRGTGKSTILEYLRWGLCDQPPSITDADEETSDFQSKRSNLIKNTLAPLSAIVTVGFSINGVAHLVKRNSTTHALSIKIGNSEFRECSEQEIREILPVRAYSQKQLSAVGVRTDELIRFIEAPIKKELADFANTGSDLKALIRTHYQSVQRKRVLQRETSRDSLEAESLKQQIEALRQTLTGLSDTDRAVLGQHDLITFEETIIGAWGRELERLEASVRQVAHELSTIPRPVPERSKLFHGDLVQSIGESVRDLVSRVKSHIDSATALLSVASEPMGHLAELRRNWAASRDNHNVLYEAVKQQASSHESQLKQISSAEARLKSVRDAIALNNEKLTACGNPENDYQQARRTWVQGFKSKADVLQKKCDELTSLSGGRIRAFIRRGAGTSLAQDRLGILLVGTNVRGKKLDELFARIAKSDYPAGDWESFLGELEELIRWGLTESSGTTIPIVPLLSAAGFSDKELERIAKKITLDEWLDLSLIELTDIPWFEYRQGANTYIRFQDASAGQQATALLRVLLNQDGPPLIIDQPEDDLDNQVVLEIVEELWKAKLKRQVIFSSHNANLVVNGDADLVVVCDYRTLSDQSGGKIDDQGAIDMERIRRKITTIMEGGKEAFRMRKDKYGF